MSESKKNPLPFLGIDMLSNETDLPTGAVRSAINVDIARTGAFGRRSGYTLAVPGEGFHSTTYMPQKGWTLVAQDNRLYRIDPTSLELTLLYTMNSADPVDYCAYNGNIYFSNRTTLGWIPSDSTQARAAGVSVPITPSLSTTIGDLTPGKYGVVVTMVDERGEESGATELLTIDLPDGGGIRLTNMPQQLGWKVLIYVTAPDGDILRLATEVPAVFSTYAVSEQSQGAECDTQHLRPLPPGELVRPHNGRIYTAKDGALYFSEAMRPHLYDPAHNVIPFSGFIAFIEPVVDGIYVGDSRGVWFLSGADPTKFTQQQVSTCRAINKSSIRVPPEHFPEKMVPSKSPVAMWLSTSGYVVGMEGGNTVELEPERIRVAGGLTGRSAFLLRNGRKQVVTLVNSTTTDVYGTAVDSDL